MADPEVKFVAYSRILEELPDPLWVHGVVFDFQPSQLPALRMLAIHGMAQLALPTAAERSSFEGAYELGQTVRYAEGVALGDVRSDADAPLAIAQGATTRTRLRNLVIEQNGRQPEKDLNDARALLADIDSEDPTTGKIRISPTSRPAMRRLSVGFLQHHATAAINRASERDTTVDLSKEMAKYRRCVGHAGRLAVVTETPLPSGVEYFDTDVVRFYLSSVDRQIQIGSDYLNDAQFKKWGNLFKSALARLLDPSQDFEDDPEVARLRAMLNYSG